MAGEGEDVYCTLLMSDSYLPGAAVLAHSLRDAGTRKKLACMVTLDTLSADTITELRELYDYLIPVDRIANPSPSNLYLMNRPDLLFAFTKIAVWRQTQFRKIVFLDADVVALRAPDELFDIKASFAASPDVGWPDAFNSGVMVLSPSEGDYRALTTLAASGDSFDGADQGLINQYFEHRPWERLSFTYNCTPNAEYQWEPAYRYHKQSIKMVHFIGKQKPWTRGRAAGGRQGVYSELLNKWWAVYDRHFKKPTPQYVPGTPALPTIVVQQHVQGEQSDVHYGIPESEHITPVEPVYTAPAPPPPPEQTQHHYQPPPEVVEAPVTTAEQPFTETSEPAQEIEQGFIQPTPTVEQRKFSAPHMEWDATRAAPPAESRPEAVNFPTQQYTFSETKELFQPPRSYPEPPKDMYYEVPTAKPALPKEAPPPIFPWELQEDRPKATRVFAEDLVSPDPEPEPSTPTLSLEEPTPSDEEPPTVGTKKVLSPVIPDEPAQPFAPISNAWDNLAGIERYVRAVMDAQYKRSKPQSMSPTEEADIEEVLSPTTSTGTGTRIADRRPGSLRESLIITDFPSEVERPSLPVTPAPIRRPMFWGEERDEAGELPSAEGVPDQAEWDPTEKLEQLRRSSLTEIEHLKHADLKKHVTPMRELPEHSVVDNNVEGGEVQEAKKTVAEVGAEEGSVLKDTVEEAGKPGLKEPDSSDEPDLSTSETLVAIPEKPKEADTDTNAPPDSAKALV